MTIRYIAIDDSKLTDENINDIVHTASYTGIDYWGNISKWNDNVYIVFDNEEDKEYRFPVGHIRDAYFKLLSLDQQYVGNYIHEYIIKSWQNWTERDGVDCGDIDAEAADAIVQVATFGEVVYG